MIITNATLENLRTMLRGEFKRRFAELDAAPVWKTLGTLVPSTTQSNTYGWLGAFPQLRRWVGPRVIRDIAEFSYQIVNKLDEATLGVARVNIEDDNLGMYRAMAAAMADEYMRYMNRNIALLIENGFTDLCYDGQPFFSDSHPVAPNTDGTGDPTDVSNIVGSPDAEGRPWVLACLSGSLKPFIVQQRAQPEFEMFTDTRNDHVFMLDEYLYGIRYRGNFGYGLWQRDRIEGHAQRRQLRGRAARDANVPARRRRPSGHRADAPDSRSHQRVGGARDSVEGTHKRGRV